MISVHREVIEVITSGVGAVRNRDIDRLVRGKSRKELLRIAEDLESFRRRSRNLYHRVRACLFIHAVYLSIVRQ